MFWVDLKCKVRGWHSYFVRFQLNTFTNNLQHFHKGFDFFSKQLLPDYILYFVTWSPFHSTKNVYLQFTIPCNYDAIYCWVSHIPGSMSFNIERREADLHPLSRFGNELVYTSQIMSIIFRPPRWVEGSVSCRAVLVTPHNNITVFSVYKDIKS